MFDEKTAKMLTEMKNMFVVKQGELMDSYRAMMDVMVDFAKQVIDRDARIKELEEKSNPVQGQTQPEAQLDKPVPLGRTPQPAGVIKQ